RQPKLFRKSSAWSAVLFVAVFADSVFAGDDDPFAVDAESSMPVTTDHLIPVDPYRGDWAAAYEKVLEKRLGLDQVYLARMIVRPAFDAEYSMRLHGDASSYAIESSKKFF